MKKRNDRKSFNLSYRQRYKKQTKTIRQLEEEKTAQAVELKQTIAHLDKENGRLEKDINTAIERLGSCLKNIKSKETTIAKMEETLSDMTLDIAIEKNANLQLLEEIASLGNKNTELVKENMHLKKPLWKKVLKK